MGRRNSTAITSPTITSIFRESISGPASADPFRRGKRRIRVGRHGHAGGPSGGNDLLHGEANLKEIALTVAGVHLESIGGAHATLPETACTSIRCTYRRKYRPGNEATLALDSDNRLDLATNGSINLKLAETLDPDLTASGVTTFQVEAHGPLQNPGLTGRIQIQNGSLSLEDLPNGLSQLQGTLEFNQNRLEVRTLTAMTGGGQLTLGGYLAYQHGIYADLSVTGQQVRIRYPEGVTSLADATLHLQGTETNLLLSGDVLITRFSASPDLDLAPSPPRPLHPCRPLRRLTRHPTTSASTYTWSHRLS